MLYLCDTVRFKLFRTSSNYLVFLLRPANQRGLPFSSSPTCFKSVNNNTNIEFKRSHQEADINTTFNEFYRFPTIKVGFALHKLKWYHTLAAGIAVPSSVLLYFTGITSAEFLWSVSVPALVLGCNLYGFAELFNSAIGFAYLSENGKDVKLSYLDFWGQRVDEIIPITDIVPLLDAPRPVLVSFKVLRTVCFYSSKKTLKMYLWSGEITDMERFTKVFGPLD